MQDAEANITVNNMWAVSQDPEHQLRAQVALVHDAPEELPSLTEPCCKMNWRIILFMLTELFLSAWHDQVENAFWDGGLVQNDTKTDNMTQEEYQVFSSWAKLPRGNTSTHSTGVSNIQEVELKVSFVKR